MPKLWDPKDPDEILDYKIDWTARIDSGDVITESIWVVDTGLTVGNSSFTNTSTTVWFSGGNTGSSYKCTNRVTTNVGRVMDHTETLKIIDK